jgi:hypothetical protein
LKSHILTSFVRPFKKDKKVTKSIKESLKRPVCSVKHPEELVEEWAKMQVFPILLIFPFIDRFIVRRIIKRSQQRSLKSSRIGLLKSVARATEKKLPKNRPASEQP